MSRLEVVCNCSAYNFPHRLTGGKCNGEEWAESYFIYEKGMCRNCNCNRDGLCEVAQGIESISECEGYQEHLQYRLISRHPLIED